MSATDLLAEQFEERRPRLRAVAYRMLGSLSEADDAVQEAWMRLSGAGSSEEIANLGAWLTTVVARVSLDMLRARRARREEYIGTWLPEPVVAVASAESDTDPEHEALVADSVGLALLVVLETLAPAERLAFVLHDMFAVPFEQIAPIVGRTPAAARQLASRGRRRVRGATAGAEADPDRQREVVEAFLAASRAGDFDALLALLDPDVVLRVDTGGERLLQPTLRGAEAVAARAHAQALRTARFCHLAIVNGAYGVVVAPRGAVMAAIGITSVGGRITAFDIVADPAKLPDRFCSRSDA